MTQVFPVVAIADKRVGFLLVHIYSAELSNGFVLKNSYLNRFNLFGQRCFWVAI